MTSNLPQGIIQRRRVLLTAPGPEQRCNGQIHLRSESVEKHGPFKNT